MDEPSFANIFDKIHKEAIADTSDTNAAHVHEFYKYRLYFQSVPSKALIFLFVTDLSDSDSLAKKQLAVLKGEFLNFFGGVLDRELDAGDTEILNPIVERIHKDLSAKISLVGFSGVGKTTITALIRAQEIPVEHVPTITGDVGTIQIGKLTFALWDFAGQEQFSFLWNKFVKGSDAILVITDSTLENVDKSRFFLELAKQQAPQAHVAIIANKQDLPGALPVPEVERLLEKVHTYSMVAVDPANREKMINIIADILEISPEISPLLKPLIERDKKMDAMETAVKNNDFQTAYRLCKEVADMCLDMGDDMLSQEFCSKGEKLCETLKKLGQIPDARPVAAPSIPQPKISAIPEGSATPSPPEISSLEVNTTPETAPMPAPAAAPLAAPALDTSLPPEARKKQIQETLLNLKINTANLDKFLLDIEMQVLLGNASEAEFQEKKRKTESMKQNIQKQIVEYQALLQSIT